MEGATVIRKTNPWDVGGRSPAERAAIAVELLREITRDIADVSSASATLLLRELAKLYQRGTPNTNDVVDKVEAFLKASMAERRLAEANMAAALLRRLYWLQIDEERLDGNTVGSASVTIYDLSTTGSNYLKTLYALTVLTKKYYDSHRRGPSNELVEVIVAEECQNYVRGRRFDDPPSIGERIVNELRAYGVGAVLIAPDPIQIPWHTARDVGAVIAIGSQALPDFLERMRHRYGRRGPTTVGKDSSTYVFHRSKLSTLRFKPRPMKPIKLRVAEAPTGAGANPREVFPRFGLRPAPGRPPPPAVVSVDTLKQPKVSVEPQQPPTVKAVAEAPPLRLEEEAEELEPEAEEEAGEQPLEEPPKEEPKAAEEELLRLEEEPEKEEPETPKEALKAEEVKQEPKGRMSWMLLRSYPPPPPHARTRPGRPAMTDAFPLGDHLVYEAEGVLSCRRCGRTAPLSEADKLAETACNNNPRVEQTNTNDVATTCDVCKLRADTTPTPIMDPLTKVLNRKMLCQRCFNDYIRMLRYAGPQVVRAKARAPPNGVWFSYGDNNSILFVQMGGVWPCPACEEFFDNLHDLAVHFAQKHPDIANRTNEKVIINVDGKPVEALKTPQGYIACPCGFLAENERHFSYHYSRDHGKA